MSGLAEFNDGASRYQAAEQEPFAARIVAEKFTAFAAERLIDERVGGRPKKRPQGVASRVRRISTPLADIVLTFCKANVEDADVVAALRHALENAPFSAT